MASQPMPEPALLGQLDPLAHGIEAVGWFLAQAAIAFRFGVGLALTLAIGAAAFATRASARRVVWAAAALLAAIWGQVLLFSDFLAAGALLYALAVVAAIVFGRANSLRAAPPAAPLWVDAAALLGVGALGLILRLYALDQLPTFVDIEPVLAFFESLSPYGLAHYVLNNRVDDDGFFHMLARYVVQQVSGPSVLGIRLAGALSNAAAVPLCYALVRRMAGVGPALIAGVVLATAPDQLIFARIEATQIGAVSLAALVTAHLVLWMVQTWSPRSALATALWMPFSRYFYAPAIALFLLPLASALHGVCFAAPRRRAAIALAIVLGGAVLWLGASPALRAASGAPWGGASSLRIYGINFYEPFGVAESAPERSGALEVVRFQSARLAGHVGDLLGQLGHDRGGYSTFYLRDHPDEHHKRAIHAALLVLLAAGLGYLLANWRDPRAALLLIWVGLGVLPALMSDEVEPRRLAVFYPTVAVIAGLFIDALNRALHAAAPRLAGLPHHAALAVLVLFIAVTSLAVHLRIPRDRLQYAEYVDFTRPYFETSDVIFHNVRDVNVIGILAFGNAEPFRTRLPGFHFVPDWDADWERVTAPPNCSYEHELFATLRSEAELAERCTTQPRARVTYLLRVDEEEERATARRLRERFPDAAVQQLTGREQDDPIRNIFALTVEHPR
jgi:hypothetical protein